MLLHVSVICSFVLLSNIPFYEWTSFILLMNSWPVAREYIVLVLLGFFFLFLVSWGPIMIKLLRTTLYKSFHYSWMTT